MILSPPTSHSCPRVRGFNNVAGRTALQAGVEIVSQPPYLKGGNLTLVLLLFQVFFSPADRGACKRCNQMFRFDPVSGCNHQIAVKQTANVAGLNDVYVQTKARRQLTGTKVVKVASKQRICYKTFAINCSLCTTKRRKKEKKKKHFVISAT